jgi:hypothetical protein
MAADRGQLPPASGAAGAMAARSVESSASRPAAPQVRGKDDRHVNAGPPVGADSGGDQSLVAGHVDRVDHLVSHRGKGASPVSGPVSGPDCLHGSAEPGLGEASGVGVDDGVGEQVVAGLRCGGVPVADADVDVGVDRRVPAAPDLFHAPRHVTGWQVVQQDPVGFGAGQAEHSLAQGAQDDLGLAIAELDAEAELAHLVVVTGEGDRATGQALTQQRDELSHPGQRPGRIVGAVPVAGHNRRGDAYADQDLAAGSQGLQAGGRHGQQRRGADLHRNHASTQPETRRSARYRAKHAERLDTGHLSDPQRHVPKTISAPGQI